MKNKTKVKDKNDYSIVFNHLIHNNTVEVLDKVCLLTGRTIKRFIIFVN